jgi:hypothetical protein
MTRSTAPAAYQFRLLDWEPKPSGESLPPSPKPVLVPDPPAVDPEQLSPIQQLRSELAASIGGKLSSGSELIRALARRTRDELIPTTLPGLDALIGGGVPRGKLLELAGRRGAGRFSVVLALLASATSMGEAAALIDLGDHFDPQVAEADGIDLTRLLWVRPRTMKEAMAAAELLMPTGFQLVVVEAGLHPIRGRRAPDAAWIRLARAAEAHGTALMVSTPYAITGSASELTLSSHSGRPEWLGRGEAPRILGGLMTRVAVEKHRHLRPGRSTTLNFLLDERIATASAQPSAGVEPVRDSAPAKAATRPPFITKAV